MTRIKKVRSPGRIGARKENWETAEQSRERKRKARRKGLTPGSRHNVEGGNQGGKAPKAPQDPRLGSRKPVALVQEDAARDTAAAPRVKPLTKALKLSPEQELEQLESDERLNILLDRVEAGDKLDKADKVWLDRTLARHQQLLEQLGLLDEEEEDAEPGDDLWDRFMDAELDPAQYREEEDKS
ncbi:Der GTPase-activating protein YihI [Oceanimonas sp. CHS3-5]|uniref:Der GTPase-activating protein YihI n=1 Tax=Oceanimonas sp. CHS3-5 TaxID=3068186 RepID=UPI00273D0345|nr:Der GTPase-activating protein YihI [Oceanimonas sp. CHS3-5]MDP5292938.1 Der GTPase-activating protein YihI [Oceanimonas sp. CHS3-5]